MQVVPLVITRVCLLLKFEVDLIRGMMLFEVVEVAE